MPLVPVISSSPVVPLHRPPGQDMRFAARATPLTRKPTPSLCRKARSPQLRGRHDAPSGTYSIRQLFNGKPAIMFPGNREDSKSREENDSSSSRLDLAYE